ncbi:MAG: lipofamily protein [Turicibacter sp.]
MNKKLVISSLLVATVLLGACSKKTETPVDPPKTETPAPDTTTDTTTGPSQAKDDKSLDVAVKDSWIVILRNDIKTDKELVFNGGLKKGDAVTPRLLALYDQDADRKKTASYKLTAPKLTFTEAGATIKGGTVVGDVYVEAENFKLVDATVEGNIHFKDEKCKTTFTMDETSKVTGKMEVK